MQRPKNDLNAIYSNYETNELSKSGLMKTIEQKKTQIEDAILNKLKDNALNDEKYQKTAIKKNQKIYSDFYFTPKKRVEPERNDYSPPRSVIRGKMLYENAMNVLQKQTEIKKEVLKNRAKSEMSECSFSPSMSPKTKNKKNYVHVKIVEKTKKSIEKMKTKISESILNKEKMEIEDCTFKPKIIKKKNLPHDEKFDKLKKIKNYVFDEKKGIWARDFGIDLDHRDSKKNKLKASDLYDSEKKQEIINKIMYPKRPCSCVNNVKTELNFGCSKKCDNCNYCRLIADEKSKIPIDEKIKGFMGYYGFKSSFIHKRMKNELENTKKHNHNKSANNIEILKIFENDKLNKVINNTLKVFENVKNELKNSNSIHYKLNEINNNIDQLNEKLNVKEKINLRNKVQSIHRTDDYTYSDDEFILFTKTKDLKYQRIKENKQVTIKDNQYFINNSTTEKNESFYKINEKTMDTYNKKIHKSEIYKLDGPYQIKSKEKSCDIVQKNLKAKKNTQNISVNLDDVFIKVYQKRQKSNEKYQKSKKLLKDAQIQSIKIK